MQVIVVGAGKVGTAICRDLSREEHEVTLIERNEAKLNAVVDQYQIMGISGNGAFYDVQMEAGVPSCDLFIAVTPQDEINIMACVVAKKLGAKYTIARVRMPEYASHVGFVQENLGISRMINPELEAAQEIYRMIRYPSALSVVPFAYNKINLVELAITEESQLKGLNLIKIRKEYNHLLVCILVRDEKTIIPRGDTVLKEGDRLFITGAPSDLGALYRSMGTVDKIRSVMIIGGGRICRYLLEMLRGMKFDIKVIESDEETANSLAEDFQDVSVIYGDGTDQSLLDNQHITGYDCVITLTGIDEENIILSMFAAMRKVPRRITKINRNNLIKMLSGMGLQSAITPPNIVATNVLRLIRGISNSEGSLVEALYRVDNSSAEVLQFKVTEQSRAVGKPIRLLPIKKGIIIAALITDGKVKIPSGADAIYPGDQVLIATVEGELYDLDDILEEA
ncbi:MAG: Trk system potassium transporter TrkA [Eubacteriales bacterium]|nr:Trk system potassium transporter TrkA [Eubacteriales bacterium]